jgi:hypothetical protein
MNSRHIQLVISSAGTLIAAVGLLYLLATQAVYQVTVNLSSPMNEGLGVNTTATLTATAIQTRVPWVVVVGISIIGILVGLLLHHKTVVRGSMIGLVGVIPAAGWLPTAGAIAAASKSNLRTIPNEMIERQLLDAHVWLWGVAVLIAVCASWTLFVQARM